MNNKDKDDGDEIMLGTKGHIFVDVFNPLFRSARGRYYVNPLRSDEPYTDFLPHEVRHVYMDDFIFDLEEPDVDFDNDLFYEAISTKEGLLNYLGAKSEEAFLKSIESYIDESEKSE